MKKIDGIGQWEDEFQFLITSISPRYESLLELEKKLAEVIHYLDWLNKDDKEQNLLGIEISKLAINYTDKLVEFFGFAEGDTSPPLDFDDAYKIITDMFLNVKRMNVDFTYFKCHQDELPEENLPIIKFAGWDKSNTRWVKMLDGKRYRITCKELGLPKSDWTKDKSIDLAKKWWLEKTVTGETESFLRKLKF
jgi:hypothetical protein